MFAIYDLTAHLSSLLKLATLPVRIMALLRTAYILLWFPKPSETFVFREVQDLRRLGLPLRMFSLYGEWSRDLSAEMREAASDVERLGYRAFPAIAAAVTRSGRAAQLLRYALCCSGGCEKWAENFWALLAGFHLAVRFQAEGIQHIHAPWASGPATAAWIASQLTGIPFSFTARAWDIHPPDGLLREKIRDAVFVRCETAAARAHLTDFTKDAGKLHVTYNGLPLTARGDTPVPMRPPYQLLAVGRFVRKKGFDQLLRALHLLAAGGVDVRLTIAGDGPQRRALQRLARRLNVAVRFTGFVPHDRISELFEASDIFVMPSVVAPSGDRDGLPTVLLEALAHRLPVIATNVAGIPELIVDNVTGFLVPERNPAALADAVRRLVVDRDAALALAGRGRDRVREMFDPDRNHRRVLELYTERQ